MKKVTVFIAWFQALNGIVKYYPNWQTGRLQRSRYLQTFSILHSLVMICGLPLLLIDTLSDNPVIVNRMTSNWVYFGAFLYVIIHTLVVLSTIYCVHFQQHAIQQMIVKLQSMDHFELPTADQRYIYSLLHRKVFLVCSQFPILFGLNFLRCQNSIPFQLLYILYKAWSDILCSAISLQIYEILWKICYCGFGIQFQLRQLLARRAQLQELLQLFKKQQTLIDVRNEFCGAFQYLMFLYPSRVLSTGVLSVYMLIRIHVGDPKALLVSFIILSFVIYSLAEFHILNNLAKVAADLIPNTIAVLRESQPQHHQVERAISWMTLQLSCQSTEIHIFGMVTLNQRLSFFLMTEIILNTLYMIQSDYYFIV